ncbi:MAG: Kae1-associated serine/threonine protein kinase, partial [Candidatus Pacearchaeota archaeon]|nr:Kae1-associated serine/threonine protein kinase [Candidatus Pacearchaeota archaeon]
MTNQKIIGRGAEAVIYQKDNLITKDRISKSYRIKELDDKIRKQRTKAEKKLLEKASKIINAPNPFPLEEFNKIKMPFIDGKKLSEHLDSFPLKKQKEICKTIGSEIAKLHDAEIIHGDLTTSNMILIPHPIVEQKGNVKKRGDTKSLSLGWAGGLSGTGVPCAPVPIRYRVLFEQQRPLPCGAARGVVA